MCVCVCAEVTLQGWMMVVAGRRDNSTKVGSCRTIKIRKDMDTRQLKVLGGTVQTVAENQEDQIGGERPREWVMKEWQEEEVGYISVSCGCSNKLP